MESVVDDYWMSAHGQMRLRAAFIAPLTKTAEHKVWKPSMNGIFGKVLAHIKQQGAAARISPQADVTKPEAKVETTTAAAIGKPLEDDVARRLTLDRCCLVLG